MFENIARPAQVGTNVAPSRRAGIYRKHWGEIKDGFMRDLDKEKNGIGSSWTQGARAAPASRLTSFGLGQTVSAAASIRCLGTPPVFCNNSLVHAERAIGSDLPLKIGAWRPSGPQGPQGEPW